MKKTLKIAQLHSDSVSNIVLDTLKINKQALVFVNSKRGAEAQAERIAAKIKQHKPEWQSLAEQSLKALSKPTRQCHRLAKCLAKGIAFHHAGLHNKQRTLIEDAFRTSDIKIICCTPSLALGLNLPSFRTIVRDLKRYGHHGYQPIPVLEYLQFIGRSGRPDFNDTHGEAITLAETNAQKQAIVDTYITGEPESIYSKLALEPVLRTYVLSLVATGFCTSNKGLFSFFSRTFYGHQYGSAEGLRMIVEKILYQLEAWEFIKPTGTTDFVSADEAQEDKLEATLLGKRVSELYLDPYTAHGLIEGMRKATGKKPNTFTYLNLFTHCLELKPLLNVKVAEYEKVEEKTLNQAFLVDLPSVYDDEYEYFLKTVKTAMFFEYWTQEKTEEFLLEHYGIRPGEINIKRERMDWLIFGAQELCRILHFPSVQKDLAKLRMRVKHGVKEELLPLLKLKQIGRVRARLLYRNGITGIDAVKKADIGKLTSLLGKQIAIEVKKQVGQEFSPDKIVVKKKKRKGQMSLGDY